jgi:hypothetical protein
LGDCIVALAVGDGDFVLEGLAIVNIEALCNPNLINGNIFSKWTDISMPVDFGVGKKLGIGS